MSAIAQSSASRLAGADRPVRELQHVIAMAFPERRDVYELPFEGTLAQAWSTFARMLAIAPADLARTLAPQFGVPAAGALDQTDATVLALVPSNFCQSHGVLPLGVKEGVLHLACANPFDANVQERLRFVTGKALAFELASPEQIDDAVVVAYARLASRQAPELGHLSASGGSALDENAVIKLGRGLLASAIKQRASDLHIQPYLGAFVVRIRVDGLLRRLTMLPDAVASSLVRYFKAHSDMDPTNIMIPQDGRMSLTHENAEFDLRVSCLPASRGERLVIRFLDQSRVHRLSQSNFSLADLQAMRRAIARPSGMVIMTGPTGSGKTSTLYGMLAELNRGSVNIITVENPVEYRVAGISQVEVNEKAGRTFSSALRSILRQDPDVVLIGEIRDKETAEIAAQAALTGHLVLTTLHTNDALTAVPRLLNLGVESTLLADALSAVVSQRLCRTLCSTCRAPVVEPLTGSERAFLEITHNKPGYRAVGCQACDYSGYHGRLPIVEILEMNAGLRDAVAAGEHRLSALEALRQDDLKSLVASGSMRIISGETTVDEVFDTVGPSFWPHLASHYGAVCFTETLELTTQPLASGKAVLLMGASDNTRTQVASVVSSAGMRLITVSDAEQAQQALHKDEDIVFIIGDVREGMGLEQAKEMLRDNRLHISWARLPAVVLLPQDLVGHETALRQSGVLAAAFIEKPVDEQTLLKAIARSHAM